MPIYRYQCEACGEFEEHIQKLSDPPMVTCESCGEPKLRKTIQAPNAHFKGSGWAKDGYGKVTMGKVGPKVSEVQAEMDGRGREAAKKGGHEAGRKAVNQYLNKLESTGKGSRSK